MSRRATTAYLAVLLTAVAALAVVVARWSLIAGSPALADYCVLAVVCAVIAAGMTGAGLWLVWRKVPTRVLRLLGGCLVVGLSAPLTGSTLFGWAGSDDQGRYNRAFGAAGRCLAGTPYAAHNVTIVHLPDLPAKAATKTEPARPAIYNRFAARPADAPRGDQLVLNDPESGDLPVPEDAHAQGLLEQHGCRW
ncbi:hypothetical protein ABT071_38035 [Streptomyces sp. NPDC002506]|uniref:hypothetical protein n=1 Tax=Streptomyces sp. NPDC002506 TaxID=3154536 RepID=UPI00331B8223